MAVESLAVSDTQEESKYLKSEWISGCPWLGLRSSSKFTRETGAWVRGTFLLLGFKGREVL